MINQLETWDVLEQPVYTSINGTLMNCNNYKALIRSDNHQTIQICKNSYQPYTNKQFLELTNQMAEITGYEFAGSCEVKGGKKVLAYLKCNQPLTVQGYEYKNYMMLGNSHDGSTGLFIGNSDIMVRCQNRFARKFRQFQVYHSKNMNVKVDQLVKEFQNYVYLRNEQYQNLEKLSEVKIDQKVVDSLMRRLLNLEHEEKLDSSTISTRTKNVITKLQDSIEQECKALGDNAFGLFNGVTHYTTHVANNSDGGSYNVFNSSGIMNTEAYEYCLNLV